MKAYLHKPPRYFGCGYESTAVDDVVEGESVDELVAAACRRLWGSTDAHDFSRGDCSDAELLLIERDLNEELHGVWPGYAKQRIAEDEERRGEDKKRRAAERRAELEREIASMEDGSTLAKKRAELEALTPAPPAADEAAP